MNKKIISGLLVLSMMFGTVGVIGAAAENDSAVSGIRQVTADKQKAVDFLGSYIPEQVKNCTIHFKGEKPIYVNGRTYQYGIELSDAGSVTYDTSKISKISFEVAHVDNAGMNDQVFQILYDGEVYQSIDLTASMANKKIELDVSDVDQLTFTLPRKYNNGVYAMVDFDIDGAVDSKGYTAPEYSNVDDITRQLFNTRNMSFYETDKKLGYKMNGRSYFNGIFLDTNGAFSVNVENMDSISFDLGQFDDSGYDNTEIYVYFDGELADTVSVSFNQKIVRKQYDLSNVDVLRIVRKNDYQKTRYALGDIEFNGIKPERLYSVPEYDNDAIKFMNAAYNTYNIQIFDNTTKLGFDMGGKNFNQGIILGDGSNFTVNTESISTITFTVGHLDSTNAHDAKLDIYYDDELAKTITLTSDKDPYEMTLDVSNADCVYFYTKVTYNGQKYGLANLSIGTEAPKPDFVKGDVNGDGAVNVQDISKLAAHVKGIKALTEDEMSRADANGDNEVNVKDISLIAAYVKGIREL